MKSKMTKLLGLTLCIAFMLCCVSCVKKPPAPDNSAKTEDINNNTPPEADLYAGLTPADYKGETFTILNNLSNYGLSDMDTEKLSTAVDSAIFSRNDYVEKTLNIEIKVENLDYTANKEMMSRLDLSNTHVYDICYNESWAQAILSQQGVYYSVNSYGDYLSLDNPWWYTDVMDDMSICNNLFYVVGDMQMMWNDSVWCMAFNKSILQSFGVEDIYQTVFDGEWDYETLYEICQQTRGSGEQRNYGVVSHITFASASLAGGGIRLIEQDSVNGLKKNGVNTRFSDVYDKILNSFFTDNGQDMANYIRTSYTSESYLSGKFPSLAYMNFFDRNQATFVGGTLGDMRIHLPSSEINYGIVPMPKYNAQQEQYIGYVFEGGAVCGIPDTIPEGEDLQRICNVMDYLSAYGYKLIRPAYYDYIVQGRIANDPDCLTSLNIVSGFDERGRTYLELDNIFRIGMASTIQLRLSDASSAIRSALGSADDIINEKLTSIVTYYLNHGGSLS